MLLRPKNSGDVVRRAGASLAARIRIAMPFIRLALPFFSSMSAVPAAPRSAKSSAAFFWRMGRRAAFAVIAGFAATGIPARAAASPDDVFRSDLQNLTLRENWRQMDMPGSLEVWSLNAGKNGDVWVGSVASAARYDGKVWKDYPLPGGMDAGPIKAIRCAANGVVYALTPVGFFSLTHGVWKQVSPVQSPLGVPGVIYESKAGDIWVGHERGFGVLRTDGSFRNFETGAYVVSFCEDRDGLLWWVEGEDRKVFRAQPNATTIGDRANWEPMLGSFDEPVRYASLAATADGRIWLGDIKNRDRLRYYDLTQKQWHEKDLAGLVGASGVFDMTQDARGRLWLCMTGALVMIDGDEARAFSPPGLPVLRTLTHIAYAQDNGLWLGQVQSAPLRLDLGGGPWRMYAGYKYECDGYGSRWFISEDGEIVSIGIANAAEPVRHRARGAIEHPIGMFATRNGEVWAIGTDGGVAAFSIYDGTAWTKQRFPEFATGFDFDSFCERADGTVVLGSGQFWDAPPPKQEGIIALRRNGREWTSRVWPNCPGGFPDRVHQIVESRAGDLFTGGSQFIRMHGDRPANENRALEAPGAWISSLKVTPDGTVWGSSYGKGVFRSRGGRYEWFHAFERGLDDVNVLDLAVLKSGDVVALTTSAIFRFDGDRWTEVLRLPLLHPLPEGGGGLKVADDGALWINLLNPAWYFHWNEGVAYSPSLEPAFSTLRYEFDTLPPVTRLNIQRDPNADGRDFTGVISASDPESRTPARFLQYSYRIDGGAWTAFSESPTIVLHQLPEGRHQIEARARDLDFNVDRAGAVATIDVRIPFWRESWFYPMLVVFAFAGILVYVLTFRHRAKQILELEQQKLNFFTNLSHEIRTPLALVMAPLERALKLSTQPEVSGYLQQARRSSEELRRIVDQLLEFRRAQSGVMQSSPENTDLVVFVADLVKSFSIMAAERKQKVTFESSPPRLPCRVDVVKLQSVLNNLVLNGLRYSPDAAEVMVRLRVEEGAKTFACLSVEDRGIGMDPDFLKIALKPFTRSRDERVRAIKGTGIGLAYVNELMTVCGGSVELVSPVEHANPQFPGTRVTVKFPIERIEPPPAPVEEPVVIANGADGEEAADGLPVLLILEDDRELGEFLCRELQASYRVLWEQDGEAGFKRAQNTIPDLIVTDRMMPKMDGFEVCRALRADLSTAHIPILMLTAASSRVNELEALRSGVSEFLGKPFSIEALEQRLKNQLAVRDGMRAKLKRDLQQAYEEEEAAKIEDPFLKKANELTEKHLGDFLFDTDMLATKLGMSRSSLYRKMHATVDMSPATFIREQRIRRAGLLLLGTTMGVAQVMEAVGIMEQRTFNKWFKATFGCNPTEYRSRNENRIRKQPTEV
jgi:signal transduction histidine kinase/DNA-binding response OmpR family regulator